MQDIQEIHLGLQDELQQFEMRQKEIGDGIIEVKRRIGILDEAMAWSPVEVEPFQELLLEDEVQAVDAEDTEIQWVNR